MTEITANGANGRTVPRVNGKASYAETRRPADHFIGGNRLENAPPSSVKDFVAQNDGHTVITNVSFPSQVEALEDLLGLFASRAGLTE
jgi:acetyl-CoA carboxylase/biotin carboxylase 1